MTTVDSFVPLEAQKAPSTGIQSNQRFILAGNRSNKACYVSLHHNPIGLAWLIFRTAKSFGLWEPGLRNALHGCKLLCRGFAAVGCYRLFGLWSHATIELPASGHLCLKVHNGYKVFDLYRGIVTKIFSPTIAPDKVRHEIALVQAVGRQGFAPAVRRWNFEERWYEEVCVRGSISRHMNRDVFWRSFENVVPPQVAPIITAFPPREIPAFEYARDCCDLLQRRLDSSPVKGLADAKLERVLRFSRTVFDRLRQAKHRPLFLALSHGDFSRHHTLITDNRPVYIDWEVAGYRTALYDLYDAFFKRLQSEPVPPMASHVLGRAISKLRTCLSQQQASLAHAPLLSSLREAEGYRWIYYLERICFFLGGHNGLNDRALNKILLAIDAFTSYEASLLNSAESVREETGVDRSALR